MRSSFVAMKGFSNPHFQTTLPSLLNRNKKARFVHQRFELDDGDFLDLAWHQLPTADTRPIIIIFHGLEGSVHSPYAFRMMEALDKKGFNSVVMHFRGCFSDVNRLARAYHSGETEDGKAFIEHMVKKYPNRSLGAVGYSLGGNMLMKLQGELGDGSPLFAAVSVSAPFRLEQTADHINSGASLFYQKILMDSLKERLLEKFEQHDYEKIIGLKKEDVPTLKSFWEYDDLFTGPIHGFQNAKDYYARSSAQQYIQHITKPTLIIHAKDDPFMPISVLPNEETLPTNVSLEVSDHGGHVGFVSGTLLKPHYWLEERVVNFFEINIT
ncbi:MAG: hydrolase [Sulfurimonadaceae bacterium]